MEHQAQDEVTLSNEKKIKVRALKGKELPKIGEHLATVLMHVYSTKGRGAAAVITSGSKLTLEALFSILELTTDWKKDHIMDLGIPDLVKVINAWMEVNHLEEVAPLFFSLREKIQKVTTSMKLAKPK